MSSRFNYYYQEENINKRVIEYEYEREFIIISSLFLSRRFRRCRCRTT